MAQDYNDIYSNQRFNLKTLITMLNASLGTYNLDMILTQGGWVTDTNTWTYASAGANYGTFTITGDLTGILTVGMKLKYVQTSQKFGVITSVSYSAPNTTVKVQGGTDYILANAAISSPHYTFVDQPYDYPSSFADTSLTPTGFSSHGTYYNRFATSGRRCTVWHNYTSAGTSNATSYTVPLPMTAKSNLISYLGRGTGLDNGSYQNNVLSTISSGGTSMSLNPQGGSVNWTASGSKSANVSNVFEF